MSLASTKGKTNRFLQLWDAWAKNEIHWLESLFNFLESHQELPLFTWDLNSSACNNFIWVMLFNYHRSHRYEKAERKMDAFPIKILPLTFKPCKNFTNTNMLTIIICSKIWIFWSKLSENLPNSETSTDLFILCAKDSSL